MDRLINALTRTEGFLAFLKGMRRDDNPYLLPELRQAWERGWWQANEKTYRN